MFRCFGFTKALLCIPVMSPLQRNLSYWCEFNVVECWLYGLAEQIIILVVWCSDGRRSIDVVAGPSKAWLTQGTAGPCE